MPIQITMPRLSDTMEEGTLVKWRVKVGDSVVSGDLLADIETDKATMELSAYDNGVVAKLVVDEGDTLVVGGLIAVLAEEGESVDDAVVAAGAAGTGAVGEPGGSGDVSPVGSAQPLAGDTPASPVARAGVSPDPGGRIRVSPVARKMAEEMGIALDSLVGTGPDGRIVKRDVLAVREGNQGTSPSIGFDATDQSSSKVTIVPLTNMRKTIARRMVESKTTIPHFTVTVAISMDALMDLRATINEQSAAESEVKLSVNDFLVRATALALVEHPGLNASWSGDAIIQHGSVNIGVAVSLPPPPKGSGGLVVPTLRDTPSKSLRQISQETRVLVAKARESGLTVEEMSGGTFTISNLGMFGVERFEAIINPPQVAILAVAAALEKPVARNGQIVVGYEMTCTLSSDHRVVDGATAAEFLETLKQMMEQPKGLVV